MYVTVTRSKNESLNDAIRGAIDVAIALVRHVVFVNGETVDLIVTGKDTMESVLERVQSHRMVNEQLAGPID